MGDTQLEDRARGFAIEPRLRSGRRKTVAFAVAGLAIAAVGVIAARNRGDESRPTRVVVDPAIRIVDSAVGTTVAAQRWDMTFDDSFQPPPGRQGAIGATISGHGTTNLNPFAMVAFATVPGYGQVTTMMSGSLIWEFGAGNYGTSPATAGALGAPLAGFAPLVEGSLGPEDGAVAMLGLGSSTGYLSLVAAAVRSAASAGTATVDGAPVTLYRLGVDPTKLAGAPGITPAEATAVADALRLLTEDGFQAMNDTVAVDASGHIREVDQVVTFADGGVATQRTTLSNFDCAATVVLPGAPPPTATGPCAVPPITAP